MSILPFDLPDSLAINEARLAHLASLGLNLERKTVLEPGAGVGRLTEFWEQRNCHVTSLDLFASNVEENLRRHPNRKHVLCRPVEIGFSDLGMFDIVFCYGLLYHVQYPIKCLADMAQVCTGLLLLETMVHGQDDGQLHFYRQSDGPDQGVSGPAYRPARNWMLEILTKFFPFVYVSLDQPNHSDYPIAWPASAEVCRSVFVASRQVLNLPSLVTELPNRQIRFTPSP